MFFWKSNGFSPKHLTTDVIATIITHVSKAMENKNNDHNISVSGSLQGVWYYRSLEWFRNYVTDRTQFALYKDTNSIQRDVTCGVPQRSMLGPLIYTNDFPNALLYSKCILFSDDITVYHTSNDLQTLRENVENDLIALSDWLRANQISLNVLKTNFVISLLINMSLGNDITSIRLDDEITHL